MALAPNQAIAALQGPQGPVDPAMAALFAQPKPQLQQMAGDVVDMREWVPQAVKNAPAQFVGDDEIRRMLNEAAAARATRRPGPPQGINQQQLVEALNKGKVVFHPSLNIMTPRYNQGPGLPSGGGGNLYPWQ